MREQSLIDEMREAMKDARERAEERREHSHESVLLATEPAAPAEPAAEEAVPVQESRRRWFFGRRQ